ncbi:uncharacterized protein C8R40DRAFT_374826 [Lentinula edodes]|uniref:uncharacterized protein n=1 Tax=Lentinula edodes TaxID=5353 RepID=UPI001E8EF0F3|nr:uncharacterized protein C8R40DRAFT_374826 [Lentinula edodes]KAH7873632.1 hypothetical protein C8R40DRAFT_374826 [Lentinula edodes]
MFFQNTSSCFVALLYFGATLLWASIQVLASPVPNPNVDIAQYERRTDFSFANSQLSKRAIEVNVDLVIGGEGKNEHWYLLIGPQLFQAGARDFATMDATKSKLTTSSYNWDEVESQLGGDYYILPLGKATYKDADDQAKAFAKIREIRMTKAAAKKGGNCMDYNMDVLKLEKKQRHITQEVVDAYKLEYDDNYTRVSKAVWGVDLRP